MRFRVAVLVATLALSMLLAPLAGDAQHPAKVYRVGVIHQGGPYSAVVDGLRDGLRELGFEEGKQFILEIRDAKGELKAVEEAAQKFQRDKVDLIYAAPTSTTIVVKRVTADIPIKKVYIIGASMGGMAAIKAAAREAVAGVITLGSPLAFQGLDAGIDVAEVKAPKLFIASEKDPYNGQSAKTFYQRAIGIKEILIFPSEAHGTYLFDTPHASALKSELFKFLEKN